MGHGFKFIAVRQKPFLCLSHLQRNVFVALIATLSDRRRNNKLDSTL